MEGSTSPAGPTCIATRSRSRAPVQAVAQSVSGVRAPPNLSLRAGAPVHRGAPEMRRLTPHPAKPEAWSLGLVYLEPVERCLLSTCQPAPVFSPSPALLIACSLPPRLPRLPRAKRKRSRGERSRGEVEGNSAEGSAVATGLPPGRGLFRGRDCPPPCHPCPTCPVYPEQRRGERSASGVEGSNVEGSPAEGPALSLPALSWPNGSNGRALEGPNGCSLW